MFELLFHDPDDRPWSQSIPGRDRARFPREGRTGSPVRGRLRCTETDRELMAVHRSELARLLLFAAGEVLRRRGEGGTLAAFPMRPLSGSAWRRRARRALHLLALDRFALPVADEVRALLATPPRRWPTAKDLTRTAVDCGAGPRGELCHAHALLAAGEHRHAEECLRMILDRDPPRRIRWRAFEGLAAVHDAAGRPLLAMGAMEAAAEDPACGVGPLVSGLYLALRAGDARRCRRAAARLDLLVHPDEPAFVATLDRLRSRGRCAGSAFPAAVTCGLTAGGGSAAERLVTALG